jgi:hypothetical protein
MSPFPTKGAGHWPGMGLSYLYYCVNLIVSLLEVSLRAASFEDEFPNECWASSVGKWVFLWIPVTQISRWLQHHRGKLCCCGRCRGDNSRSCRWSYRQMRHSGGIGIYPLSMDRGRHELASVIGEGHASQVLVDALRQRHVARTGKYSGVYRSCRDGNGLRPRAGNVERGGEPRGAGVNTAVTRSTSSNSAGHLYLGLIDAVPNTCSVVEG